MDFECATLVNHKIVMKLLVVSTMHYIIVIKVSCGVLDRTKE
jgi:hypothetical protein